VSVKTPRAHPQRSTVAASTDRRDAHHASLIGFDRTYMSSFLSDSITGPDLDPAELLTYAPVEGSTKLRETISGLCGVDLQSTLVTEGASEAVALLFAALASRGLRVLVPALGLPAYAYLARMFGGVPQTYDICRDASGTARQIEQAIQDGIGVVVVNTPHNPTGQHLDESGLFAVVQACRKAGAWLIVDHAYRWMAGQEMSLAPDAKSLFAAHERVAIVLSIGKYLCLPGLRMGAVLAPSRDLMSVLAESRSHFTHCSSPMLETFATSLLASAAHDEARRQLRTALAHRRRTLEATLRALGAQPHADGSGFYVYADEGCLAEREGIYGLDGCRLGGKRQARRYCLAAPSSAWRHVEHVRDAVVPQCPPRSTQALNEEGT